MIESTKRNGVLLLHGRNCELQDIRYRLQKLLLVAEKVVEEVGVVLELK